MFNIPIRVKNLIRKYDTSSPYELAKYLNITIYEYDLPPELRGFCVRVLRRKMIFLSQSMTEIEKTIVLCHELGHIRLHSEYGYHFSANTIYFVKSRCEAEANLYAAYLLSYRHDIDSGLIHRIISEKHPDPKTVHTMLNDIMRCEFN
ncbi:ImmA/IrrE family metallo-endopeptidase [Pectinatus haikarae]|uniref:ImmA/IrrE family metallo-endopeptidase n=1 Tax=Pectinatus haikarae TaxID=349096 RepID=UPI0018C72EE1|nr:ImmA/IrrE family metallo-endopeptidase [Pectinatus haikarae]